MPWVTVVILKGHPVPGRGQGAHDCRHCSGTQLTVCCCESWVISVSPRLLNWFLFPHFTYGETEAFKGKGLPRSQHRGRARPCAQANCPISSAPSSSTFFFSGFIRFFQESSWSKFSHVWVPRKGRLPTFWVFLHQHRASAVRRLWTSKPTP